jgi:Lipocalin-like domain
MRKLLLIGIVSLCIGMPALSGVTQSAAQHGSLDRSPDRSPDRSLDDDVRDQFVGAWRLASLEQPGADGKVHRIDCCGMLVYTRDGHMSVQVMEREGMEREPQAQTPAGPEQYSQGGYEASYGSYDVNAQAHTFTFHVDGALVRTLIGKDLPRAYEFSGKQLIVKSTRPDEDWRVVWERY